MQQFFVTLGAPLQGKRKILDNALLLSRVRSRPGAEIQFAFQ
jgi:hypothetical protein